MDDAGIGGSGNAPPLLSQAQAEFGVLPVEKESIVKQPGILEGRAGDQQAGPIEGAKPIISTRHCAVAAVAYPQIRSGTGPSLYDRWRISIVADGGDRPNALVRHGLCHERRKRIRRRLRIVVQQPQILGAVPERITDSDVIAPRKTQILMTLKQQSVGMSRPYSGKRVIGRAVVYHDNGQAGICAFL